MNTTKRRIAQINGVLTEDTSWTPSVIKNYIEKESAHIAMSAPKEYFADPEHRYWLSGLLSSFASRIVRDVSGKN